MAEIDRREYTWSVEEQHLKKVKPLDPKCPYVHVQNQYIPGKLYDLLSPRLLSYFQQFDYNDEECYTDHDGYDLRKVKVDCPNCGRNWCALMSHHTKELCNALRWVSCDVREPSITYGTKCVRCNASFMFTTHTPQ